jgi:hypothetical protein
MDLRSILAARRSVLPLATSRFWRRASKPLFRSIGLVTVFTVTVAVAKPGSPEGGGATTPWDDAADWIALVLEIVGLFLLAREVWRGHEMEEIQHDMELNKRMNYLYTCRDYEGFYVARRLEKGETPAKVQDTLKLLNAAALQQAVEQEWAEIAPEVAASTQRWEQRTAPGAMRGRRISLIAGTACLMLAAVIHAVD